MGMTETTTLGREVKLAWVLALVLYGFCWWLPIVSPETKIYIGFDGARIAHEEFWKLITKGQSINSASDVLGIIFTAIGWLANELFVLGVATFLRWPRVALRSFAFSLGIMISWQVALLDELPFLVGYWFWVAAGTIMLGLSAIRVAQGTGSRMRGVLAERTTLALLILPILNAAVATGLNSLP